MRLFKTLIPACLLLASASSFGQITKTAQGYKFLMKFTKGQTLKYDMSQNTTMPGQQQGMAVQTPFSMNVKSISGKVATIKFSIGPMVMNGKKTGTENTMEMKMDTSGKIVDAGQSAAQLQTTQVTLPTKPIPVGGTWKTSMNTNTMGVPMKVDTTYKLLGFTQSGKFNVAKVGVTIVATGQVSSKGSGTMLLSTSDSSLVGASIKQTLTMKGQGGQPMNISSDTNIKRK